MIDKLKNDNEYGINIWRYQHFYSNSTFRQKRATLIACLRKVHTYASDRAIFISSALAKIAEFRRLRYPIKLLFDICSFLGATSGEGMWIELRGELR